MFKKKAKYLFLSAVIAIGSLAIVPNLTSCGILIPTMTVHTPTQALWAVGGSFTSSLSWVGYFSDEITDPVVTIDEGHGGDVTYKVNRTHVNSNQYLEVYFSFMTGAPNPQSTFNIHIKYSDPHLNITKESDVLCNDQFVYNDTVIDSGDDPAEHVTPIDDTSVDSYSAVRSYYQTTPETYAAKAGIIYSALWADFIYTAQQISTAVVKHDFTFSFTLTGWELTLNGTYNPNTGLLSGLPGVLEQQGFSLSLVAHCTMLGMKADITLPITLVGYKIAGAFKADGLNKKDPGGQDIITGNFLSFVPSDINANIDYSETVTALGAPVDHNQHQYLSSGHTMFGFENWDDHFDSCGLYLDSYYLKNISRISPIEVNLDTTRFNLVNKLKHTDTGNPFTDAEFGSCMFNAESQFPAEKTSGPIDKLIASPQSQNNSIVGPVINGEDSERACDVIPISSSNYDSETITYYQLANSYSFAMDGTTITKFNIIYNPIYQIKGVPWAAQTYAFPTSRMTYDSAS